ncbi:GNAT family N-acetyltransferase [Brunnivagina elsteri]|uniref:GNAT family N-acetyltransferase n=1 Tax=Brunnivagina elsteri CCALA 953 TaxID=987040 RepID=A0A2A2TJR7_9CYAN|nr:GNAT family N-acetyltransferase [Calothrix elsteri]PAX54100.1 GNAT family N-acetyltransferase [Calothrix elsteri CCALA 953]
MNQRNCIIRKAELEDLSTIVSFNQSLAMEVRGEKLESEIITSGVEAVLKDSNRGFYTLVEIESKIIAIALITFEWSDWRNAWFWWLQDVYVEPSYRQQGIFRSLYMHLKQQAQLAQVSGLRLYVYKGNTKAQEVYQRIGMNPSNSLIFEDFL